MPSTPAVGAPFPDFTLPGGILNPGPEPEPEFTRSDYTLSSARGRSLVLAFYPGDNTAVCTRQLCAYSAGLDTFADLDAQVWGVSTQDVDSHESFARARDLRLPLLADTDSAVSHRLGITAPVIGLRRAVFLIDPEGVLRWKHVALLGVTYQSVDTLRTELEKVGG
ncbi:peroxiredoxin family protein [Streptomyces sp. NPDC049954]|uniref:peroxiredoxin family protein n=1 Tax=Streptomyces sp. NPDC049954 TaxID=3155779 RepID=UPI00341D07E9